MTSFSVAHAQMLQDAMMFGTGVMCVDRAGNYTVVAHRGELDDDGEPDSICDNCSAPTWSGDLRPLDDGWEVCPDCYRMLA